MAQKRTRSENFSSVEKQLLLELISEQRCIVENKKTDAASTRQKELAWKSIAEKFWGKSGKTRSIESLKTFWDNIKKRAKKALGDKIKVMRTGNGTAVLIDDPVLRKVKDILSLSFDSSENLYDCNIELVLPAKQVKQEADVDERSADDDDDDSIQIMLNGTQESMQASAKGQSALKIPKTVNLEPLTLNENEETAVLSPNSSIFLLLTNSSSLVAAPASSSLTPTSSTPTCTSLVPTPISSAAVPVSSATTPASFEAVPATSSAHIPSVARTFTTAASTASTSSRWKRGRAPMTLLKPVAERLSEAKLKLTELAIEHAKEELSMKKALFSVRCEYEKTMVEYSNTMLEIAKLELKKKNKQFEIEFKESAE